jgi:hypothetical protein
MIVRLETGAILDWRAYIGFIVVEEFSWKRRNGKGVEEAATSDKVLRWWTKELSRLGALVHQSTGGRPMIAHRTEDLPWYSTYYISYKMTSFMGHSSIDPNITIIKPGA